MLSALLIGLICLTLYYLYRENHRIQVSRYKIRIPHTRNKLKGIKIVQLTDLHLPNGGASTDAIIETAKREKPHVIVLTGDLVHAGAKDFPTVELTHFVQGLDEVAPVYAVTGNHDLGIGQMQKWTDVLESAGVKVLLNKSEWVPFGEEGFVLMGLAEEEELHPGNRSFLKHVRVPEGKENLPRILLAHHPEFFEDYLKDTAKAPDLIFSGHAHGGQVILPFTGGLFAPGQGVNPQYDFGVYPSQNDPTKRMVVSRGLGNSTFPLRINNRPEVVVVTLE